MENEMKKNIKNILLLALMLAPVGLGAQKKRKPVKTVPPADVSVFDSSGVRLNRRRTQAERQQERRGNRRKPNRFNKS